MPELPEVEVVRLTLQPHLEGRTIRGVDVRSPRLREPLDAATLGELAGRRVNALRRRAKYLWIDVDGDRTLVIHLGMSGRLTLVDASEPPAKHEHVAFLFGEAWRLRLVDPRRFGLAFAVPTSGLEGDRHFSHLGIEPLAGSLDGPYLARQVVGRRGPIKTFLMDGRVVVGVGNIYASEALWLARVHPKRSVARISAATWQRLSDAVFQVLDSAVRQGGTTLNDFADGEGNAGYFQISLEVYGREGQPCRRCQALIRRLVQANRSTFYCPRCQR